MAKIFKILYNTKELIWLGRTKRMFENFPCIARQQAGAELLRVQDGRLPRDWKPMSNIGPGAIEIRIHRPYEHRVIYMATYPEGIYILNAFAKKSQKTLQREIRVAKINYGKIQEERKKIQKQTIL